MTEIIITLIIFSGTFLFTFVGVKLLTAHGYKLEWHKYIEECVREGIEPNMNLEEFIEYREAKNKDNRENNDDVLAEKEKWIKKLNKK